VVVRAYLAHHQGMTLVALSNALLDDVMVKRFHADPRVQATELLLQERVPRQAPVTQPRPAEETRLAALRAAAAIRRFRSAHTRYPHAQFLSNGNYIVVVTNGGGGASLCRGRAVTRYRDDPTRDPGSQFIYLRDVRSGLVWSPATSRSWWCGSSTRTTSRSCARASRRRSTGGSRASAQTS
jgi:cyclic beta-1,2-glucan synthetase